MTKDWVPTVRGVFVTAPHELVAEKFVRDWSVKPAALVAQYRTTLAPERVTLSKGAFGFGTTVIDRLEVLLVLGSGVLALTLTILVKVPSTPA